MNEALDTVRIEQCLHGYDKGHRLLASSCELPKNVRSLLDHRSDASMSGYGKGKPQYLTGYPVPEISAYAFARTWPAPEMPRPGCVWTHTLIINYSDLARLPSLHILPLMFQHPSNEKDYSWYEEPAKVVGHSENVQPDVTLISQIVSNLYEKPEEEVILPWSNNVERALICVWSQQWPKLRRSFTFRTFGTPSNETLFTDLLFIDSNEKKILPLVKNQNSSGKFWINAVVKDAKLINGTSLRTFLWQFGADCFSTRGGVESLVNIWIELENDSSNNVLESAWRLIFNWRECPRSLILHLVKKTVYLSSQSLSLQTKKWLVNSLQNLRETDLSDNDLIQLAQLISSLPSNELIKALSHNNIFSNRVVGYVIQNLSINSLIILIHHDHTILSDALVCKPQICYEQSFWENCEKFPEEIKKAIIDGVIQVNPLVNAMLKASAIDLAPEIIHIGGIDAITQIYHYFSDSTHVLSNDVQVWLQPIFNKQIEALEAFYSINTISIDLLETLSKNLSVNQENPLPSGDAWLTAYEKTNKRLSEKHQFLAVFLLSRGLLGVEPDAHKLIAASFDTVHKTLRYSQMDSVLWMKLEKILPQTFLLLDWDRCNRVRKGIVSAYLTHGLLPSSFIEVTKDNKLFYQILNIAKESVKGREFLCRVAASKKSEGNFQRMKMLTKAMKH